MPGAGDLKNRVEVLSRIEGRNELNETTYTYEPKRKIWAQIVPLSGRTEEIEGSMERVAVSHRFTVRRSSLPELSTDLAFRYRGQTYQVVYFYPNYRDGGFLDVFCGLVVEDGIQSF